MKFSINWLKDYVDISLSSQELADVVSLHSLEVEGVEVKGDDAYLDVALLPNRFPDAANYVGFAREIGAVTGGDFKADHFFKKGKKLNTTTNFSVHIEKGEDCMRYSGLLMSGVEIKDSPVWLKERLEAGGLRSINNIVDATNYVMLELGQPLHAFDYERLDKGIIVRRARDKERMTTLDNRDVELTGEDVVIADHKEVLAIAGVKGGRAAEITNTTKTILLEAANFDPDRVVRTTRRIGFTTDAFQRFKYGIDPNMTEIALRRVAELIQKIGGGKVGGFVDAYPNKVASKVLAFSAKHYEKLVGEPITLKEARDIFRKLQWDVKKATKEILWVEVPTWRRDVERFEDVVEEVVRLYGYDTLKSKTLSRVSLHARRDDQLHYTRKIKERMAGFGFDEMCSYSFIPQAWNEVCDENTLVQLENPVSAEYYYLRPTLILPLFRALESNVKFFSDIKMFEVGNVFSREKNNEDIVERTKLAGMLTREKGGDHLFYECKGTVNELFHTLGVDQVEYRAREEVWCGVLIQSRSADIYVSGVRVGCLGVVSPRWLERFDVVHDVVAFELDLNSLLPLTEGERRFVAFSKYPEVVRDISFVVGQEVRISEIEKIIGETSSSILVAIDLFDMFEGERLGEGKKSLSFHLIFRSDQKTLTGEEVTGEFGKIITALQERFDIEVR
ncbi:MAG: phenylalanine--tRNA ligase subunit beta [Parcubacteria group bacterium]|nr:phenylalanine--tRNA ligase subunit beta [Parcubacteria group bacterium]